MNSKICSCHVSHIRFKPIHRSFNYCQSMFYLDLDEISELKNFSPWLGLNKFFPLAFINQDHLIYPRQKLDKTLKQAVLEYIQSQNKKIDEIDKVFLLTNLRNFGYVFNPISVYVCFNNNKEIVYIIYEVGNTFGEQKLFLTDQTQWQQKKFFYVSPFINLDTDFDFKLKVSADDLFLNIKSSDEESIILNAWVKARFLDFNRINLVKTILYFPFNSLKVFLAIHFQALRIWMRRLPYLKKDSLMEKQKEVLNGKS